MPQQVKPRKLPLHRLLLIGIAFLLILLDVIGLYPNLTTPIERVELSARDALMRLRGVRQPSEDIVIVAIDDFSFNWTEYHWPWPRSYEAEIIKWLNEAGASVIGLDIFLFESDPEPAGDQALVSELGKARASASVVQIFDYKEEISPGQYIYTETAKLPLPIYREVLDGMGTTFFIYDEDAIVRSIQAYDTYVDQVYPHWAFEISRLYLGVEPASNFSSTGLSFNNKRVPLQRGQFMVNFAGPAGTYPTYSAARVALGDYPAEAFRDKIVLIGVTTMTLQDIHPTPYSASEPTPGVEIVANAIDTLLTGNYVRSLPPWVNLLFLPLMALIAGLIGRMKNPTLTIGVMTGAMLVYAVGAFLLFSYAGLYLPITMPEAMLFLGIVLPTLEQAVSQELEKRRIREMFTRFISPEMVDQLLTTQDVSTLNKRAYLTILFSDIRGFTTLSERLTPEQVVALLNPYLEAMTNVVHKHGGTVDKYEGDAIVAFFGEPVPYSDHALRAARAAVEMRVVLAQLREQWKAEGRLPGRFEIGIGLNTGEVFVGMLGSAKRINYTVIGDNVNLAARLQDLTKVYAWPIIISESTAQSIEDEFDVEFVEAANVKGKREPVRIYKVLGRKGASESERVQALEA